MTAEQQLERSVLEGKEREELSAIAQAMSLKTNSRTKKADIIDQILDATGVTSGSQAASNGDGEGGDTNGVKPSRRTRSVSASASAGSDEAADTVAGSASAGAGHGTHRLRRCRVRGISGRSALGGRDRYSVEPEHRLRPGDLRRAARPGDGPRTGAAPERPERRRPGWGQPEPPEPEPEPPGRRPGRRPRRW